MPSESEEPTTVTTPPPEARPTLGRTLSATPPSAKENDTPLELYAPGPRLTSTDTRPAECAGLAHWLEPPVAPTEEARAATGDTLPKRHDEPLTPPTPPSNRALTRVPPLTGPRDGLTERTPRAPPRRKAPPPTTKPSSGPTTPSATLSSPASPAGASHRASELDTDNALTAEADSPKRHHGPAPTMSRPDTRATVPPAPADGDKFATVGALMYRKTMPVIFWACGNALMLTKP